MSWWTNIRDIGEVIGTGGAALLFNESARNKAEGLFNTITGRPSAEQKRAMSNQINDQIRAYKEQTELSRQQLSKTRAEEAAQKRIIQEKQIRSIRRNYRSPGLIGAVQGNLGDSASGSQSGMSSKLGG